MTPQQIADHVGRTMWIVDQTTQGLGMVLDSIGPGSCVMSMTVTRAMLNGVGTCHGGYIYMVADSCMGYACNAHGRKAVLQHSSIVYLRPGRLGDRLVATAHMRSRAGRTALYDIGVERVTPEGRELLAEFRGQSRELDDSWV